MDLTNYVGDIDLLGINDILGFRLTDDDKVIIESYSKEDKVVSIDEAPEAITDEAITDEWYREIVAKIVKSKQ